MGSDRREPVMDSSPWNILVLILVVLLIVFLVTRIF